MNCLNIGSTTNINHCFELSIKDKKYISFLNVASILHKEQLEITHISVPWKCF